MHVRCGYVAGFKGVLGKQIEMMDRNGGGSIIEGVHFSWWAGWKQIGKVAWLRLAESRSQSKIEAFGHREKLSRPKISQFTLYYRDTVHKYLERIRELKADKISWVGMHPDCKFAAVDTIHVCSEEFRCDPSIKWWSHKFNGPGLSF